MSPDLEAAFITLFNDMAEAWRRAPGPEPVAIGDGDLRQRGEIGVVAVIHGWMARLVRTGEAALLCLSQGFGEECSPLVRSMMEHAIGLFWLVDRKGDAFQTLVRARSMQMQKLQKAQEDGWSVGDDEMQELLRAAITTETDESGKSDDHLLHLANQAKEYALGSLYQGWLVETWTSHPSYASASAYFVQGDDQQEPNYVLLPSRQGDQRPVAAAVVSAMHLALFAYNKLLSGEPLSGPLEGWLVRSGELAERLAAEQAGH